MYKKAFVILFLIASGCMTIYYYGAHYLSSTKQSTKSAEIPAKREYPVNSAINPCDDFYSYACSKVIDSFQLREDRSHHSFASSDSAERLLEVKKQYLKKLVHAETAMPREQSIKNYYIACMDLIAGSKEELAMVQRAKQLLDSIDTREKFIELVAANLTKAGLVSFLNFHTSGANQKYPAFNDLVFGTSLMKLPDRSYYENVQLMEDYQKLVEDFFRTIGDTSPAKKAKMVVDFEKRLALIYPTSAELYKKHFSKAVVINRKELIVKYPQLRLEKFLAGIPSYTVIRDMVGDKVLVFINEKLEQASLEELKAIYLFFQLSHIMDDAFPQYFDKKFEFQKKHLGGPAKRSVRDERCTKIVMYNFEKEIDFILLPKVFPNFPKEKFVTSIEKIRRSLIGQLEKNTWLNATTRAEAIRKIETAKLALVSPNSEEEWDFNPPGSYENDTPLTNARKLQQLLLDKSLAELSGPVNRNRWHMGPLTVNAYYDPCHNRVVFPVGILQYPFYDANEPEEINLGAIGATIGHELSHAIDNNGSIYSADGIFREWLSGRDLAEFKRRISFLVKQFDYIGHNGEFTLGENIADLVGLITAHEAAFPADEFHNRGLKRKFFLQYARSNCAVEREGVTKMRLKTDPHALEYARVNEPLKQMRAFQEAYGCKMGDKMVLPDSERIRVW